MATSNHNFCKHCGEQLKEDARFCSACGRHISIKSKISGITQRFRYKTKTAIENIKQSLDSQITEYLNQFDNNQEVRIGGIRVPENRRKGVHSAMLSFQNKYLEGDPAKSTDYDEWVSELTHRLQDNTCIVCFTKWNDSNRGEIVVCPYCDSGGHRPHIEGWIKSKQYCPLCRNSVNFSEFITLI